MVTDFQNQCGAAPSQMTYLRRGIITAISEAGSGNAEEATKSNFGNLSQNMNVSGTHVEEMIAPYVQSLSYFLKIS